MKLKILLTLLLSCTFLYGCSTNQQESSATIASSIPAATSESALLSDSSNQENEFDIVVTADHHKIQMTIPPRWGIGVGAAVDKDILVDIVCARNQKHLTAKAQSTDLEAAETETVQFGDNSYTLYYDSDRNHFKAASLNSSDVCLTFFSNEPWWSDKDMQDIYAILESVKLE